MDLFEIVRKKLKRVYSIFIRRLDAYFHSISLKQTSMYAPNSSEKLRWSSGWALFDVRFVLVSLYVPFTSSIAFTMQAVTGTHEVPCVQEYDASFGGIGFSLRRKVSKDGAKSISSSFRTNGLNGVTQGRFDVYVDTPVTITSLVYLPRMPEPCCPVFLNCFWMRNTRNFSVVTKLSAQLFPNSHLVLGQRHVIQKHGSWIFLYLEPWPSSHART